MFFITQFDGEISKTKVLFKSNSAKMVKQLVINSLDTFSANQNTTHNQVIAKIFSRSMPRIAAGFQGKTLIAKS